MLQNSFMEEICKLEFSRNFKNKKNCSQQIKYHEKAFWIKWVNEKIISYFWLRGQAFLGIFDYSSHNV